MHVGGLEGGVCVWEGGSHKVSADLEKAVGSNPAAHHIETMESTSASRDQHAHSCEVLLFYDWNILLSHITQPLFSLCLSPSCCCKPSAVNHLLYVASSPVLVGSVK